MRSFFLYKYIWAAWKSAAFTKIPSCDIKHFGIDCYVYSVFQQTVNSNPVHVPDNFSNLSIERVP